MRCLVVFAGDMETIGDVVTPVTTRPPLIRTVDRATLRTSPRGPVYLTDGYDVFAFTQNPVDDSAYLVQFRPWKKEGDGWVCRAKNWQVVVNASESH